MKPVNPGGRPADASAAPRLMAAARDLINARGYAAVTIDMIADAAGVGRQMVYRRWRSKADLVLDAYLIHAHAPQSDDSDDVRCLLEAFLNKVFIELQVDGAAIRSLIASAQSDDAFRATLDERFAKPRNAVVLGILQHGIAAGQLPADVDAELLAEVIHGAYWYRLLVGRSLDAEFAARLTDLALGGRKVAGAAVS